ncbi:right-handed parallel beta-helix repeat-containing protein [Haloechinothrix sp. LS1_15]|uniref:right-handed parallel beta-helix repeat-containing protein n=1 Tax=Haloechinothrix sp. LS1_15 TaxID=2652248 RepID=UPI0029451920|nr:right-handed parallel beta-helix repeat-containing protein [Haloechinothrix sp. LS1_15]MDV6013346.1 DUF1565 domain-containing protein [Haloechinothrix sp. LS1_15]
MSRSTASARAGHVRYTAVAVASLLFAALTPTALAGCLSDSSRSGIALRPANAEAILPPEPPEILEPALERPEPPVPPSEPDIPEDAMVVATSGDDDAAGTREAPLRTLAEAIDRAEKDATIVLREGVYRESVGMIRTSVTIQSYPGEEVWFRGSTVVDDWSAGPGYWEHTDWVPDFCRDCFIPEIIDDERPLAGRPDMVFVDGEPLGQVADRDELEPGTFLVDTDAPAVLIGDDPSEATVEVATHDHLLQFDGDEAAGSIIEGIGVEHYASRQDYGTRSAMVVVNAPDVTITGSTFAWSASTGLAVFQPGATVAGNHLRDNGLVGLLANRADGLTVAGNTITGNNARHFTLTGEAIGAAGSKVTRTDGVHVAGNIFAGNHATGWWCDLGCTDATVVGNQSTDNLRHGFYYEVSSQALIGGNVSANNGGEGLKISSSDGVEVYHNTFTGNDLTLGIYNDPRDPEFDPHSDELGLTWLTSDTVLVNNVFAQDNTERPVIHSADGKDEQQGNPPFVSRANGNVYLYEATANRQPLVRLALGDGRIAEFASLAELRGNTSFEGSGAAGELPASPFTAADQGDYTLREGIVDRVSPANIPARIAERIGIEPGSPPGASSP